MRVRLRIGTRGSRLARAQAGWVQDRLTAARPEVDAELVIIQTSGDRLREGPLATMGGKGLFVKEIEAALIAGEIDCAVHSLKDMPADLAPGLIVAAVPKREDAADVLVTRRPGGFAALSPGARIGTCSPRRAALLRASGGGLQVVDIRGNVDTRLRKLADGAVDGIMLASAGLRRLGISHPYVEPCDPRQFVPAIGQGALAIESRAGQVATLLATIEDSSSRRAVDAERAFLSTVGGSCVTPLAAHATVDRDGLMLNGLIAAPDGTRIVRGETQGPSTEAVRLGSELAERLLSSGGAEILRQLNGHG